MQYYYIVAYTARQLVADLLDADLDELAMEGYDKLSIEVQGK